MKISFVVPVFNGQATIARTIRSLLAQTHKDKEIIVINDGSTDNTDRIIRCFEKDLVYINRQKPRSGGAVCRNIANGMANGEIIAVCDADTYYPERGEAIAEFFSTYKDKHVFYSALHLKDSRNIYKPGLMEAYEWDFKSKCPISHPTIAYRSEVARNCRYTEETLESDLYEFFLLEAHSKGYEFGWSQVPLMEKIEGNTIRKKKKANALKKKKYEAFGIDIG